MSENDLSSYEIASWREPALFSMLKKQNKTNTKHYAPAGRYQCYFILCRRPLRNLRHVSIESQSQTCETLHFMLAAVVI